MDKKKRLVSVYIDTALYEKIAEQAKKEGRPVSQYIAKILTKASEMIIK